MPKTPASAIQDVAQIVATWAIEKALRRRRVGL